MPRSAPRTRRRRGSRCPCPVGSRARRVVARETVTAMPLSLSVLDPVPPAPPEERSVPSTLAADLALDRLLHRVVRLDRVIAALHARARAYEGAAVPPPLRLSLAEVGAEG